MPEDSDSGPGQRDSRHSDTSGHRPSFRPVPPLPHRLAEPTPVVLAGTLLWFGGFAVFGLSSWTTGTAPGVWFWTCFAGWVLGVAGYGVFRWQRSASRRGSRGAWRGLSGLDG